MEMWNVLLETGGKGNPCYKVAKNLAELCSSVLWKIELLSNETSLAEKMSMQSVEGATWFLLTAFMVKYERREINWRRNMVKQKDKDL